MKYLDVDIISKRLEFMGKEQQSLDEIVIDGKVYSFERRKLDDAISMIIPTSFEEMPLEMVKRKFPNEQRPKTIISCEDMRVCLLLDIVNGNDEILSERIENMQVYVKRIAPANTFYTNGIYTLASGLQIGHFDYSYPAVDNDIYNITFITDFEENEVLGWLVCPIEFREKWEPVFRLMIESIEFIGVNE